MKLRNLFNTILSGPTWATPTLLVLSLGNSVLRDLSLYLYKKLAFIISIIIACYYNIYFNSYLLIYIIIACFYIYSYSFSFNNMFNLLFYNRNIDIYFVNIYICLCILYNMAIILVFNIIYLYLKRYLFIYL